MILLYKGRGNLICIFKVLEEGLLIWKRSRGSCFLFLEVVYVVRVFSWSRKLIYVIEGGS